MLINKYWALCKISLHETLIEDFGPLAYLSKELCDNLIFLKPYLCDLVIGNKKYEFNVLPLVDDKAVKNNIFCSNHEISVPVDYFEPGIESRINVALVRTDIF